MQTHLRVDLPLHLALARLTRRPREVDAAPQIGRHLLCALEACVRAQSQFVRSIRSFVRLSICSYVHLFIHSFVRVSRVCRSKVYVPFECARGD